MSREGRANTVKPENNFFHCEDFWRFRPWLAVMSRSRLGQLVDGILRGDRASLARAITLGKKLVLKLVYFTLIYVSSGVKVT